MRARGMVLMEGARGNTKGDRGDRGEPPPFGFVRLSFVESREKVDKNGTRDRTTSADLLSVT